MGECRVYAKPAEVTTQLAALGVSVEDLTKAVQVGDREASYCTNNDPRVLRNFTRWGKTFRGLADGLTVKKWSHEERRCLPLMESPDHSIAITVSSGDERTGRVGPTMPRTRNPKGPSTKAAVDDNQDQIPGMGTTVTQLRPKDEESTQTWILLYYLDRQADEIRCELSLPASISPNGVVAEWFNRIILVPVQRVPTQPSEEEDEETIDITIERRKGE